MQGPGQAGRRNHPVSWRGKGKAQPPHLEKELGKQHGNGLKELGKESGRSTGRSMGGCDSLALDGWTWGQINVASGSFQGLCTGTLHECRRILGIL